MALVQTIRSTVIYTDGSCINNGKKNKRVTAGYGVRFVDLPHEDMGMPFTIKPLTNNRAELYAIFRALKAVRKVERETKSTVGDVYIYTDSQYSMNALTKWIVGWKRNGWVTSSDTPVLNVDLIKPIHKILTCKRFNGRVHINYVKGHSSNIHNNAADRLAKQGSALSN